MKAEEEEKIKHFSLNQITQTRRQRVSKKAGCCLQKFSQNNDDIIYEEAVGKTGWPGQWPKVST